MKKRAPRLAHPKKQKQTKLAQDFHRESEEKLNGMAQATAEISDDKLAKALETVLGKGIEGVWLRRTGGEDGHGVEVLVQMDGDWFIAIAEDLRANFSHSAYLAGAYNWPLAFPELEESE